MKFKIGDKVSIRSNVLLKENTNLNQKTIYTVVGVQLDAFRDKTLIIVEAHPKSVRWAFWTKELKLSRIKEFDNKLKKLLK